MYCLSKGFLKMNMEHYANAAKSLGLTVIEKGTHFLVKGLTWSSKPIKSEVHFKNTILKFLKEKAPELRNSLTTLRQLMKTKPTPPVKLAYNNMYGTVKMLHKLFPDIKL